jgi:hypothetical protein
MSWECGDECTCYKPWWNRRPWWLPSQRLFVYFHNRFGLVA